MIDAYLTIDDTPSADTDKLTDYMRDHDIPAVLYCRGDRLSENADPAVRAIEKGFVLGNHAYSHTRASTLSFEEVIEEIEKTERLIDRAYAQAQKERPYKSFRFPHMDRGTGGWVVDYDGAPEEHRDTLIKLFSDGLNISLSPPHEEQIEKKDKIQSYLKAEGFISPFTGITLPWYAETEMADAIDAMFTFSTSDWMVTPRHAGKWPYKTADDLKQKIDDDPYLYNGGSRHIILAHDQAGLCDVVIDLLAYFGDKGVKFVDV